MDMPPPIIQYDLTYTERWALDPARLHDAWDHCHAVATLQGNVNRKEPRLYVRAIRQPESGDVNLDDWWLDRLRAKGAWLEKRPIHALPQDIEGLVRQFRDDIQGLVVYDASVPATSNVASTAAGVDRLIAVRWDPRPDSLYSRLRAMGLPVKTWLIHEDGAPMFTGKGTIPETGEPSSGSAKNDAYRWAAAKYLENGRCSTDAMGYYIDAAWLRNPNASTFWNHTLTNHDYFVAKRSFFFDLSPWADEPATDDPNQPLGTDLETLQRILGAAAKRNDGKRMMHIGGFIPWAFKYSELAGSRHEGVPSEWEFVRIISQYNAYLDADALGLCSMANASFYRFQPLPPYPEEKPIHPDRHLDETGKPKPKHYVTFYVGDYDAASWLYQMLPRLWEDPARGSVPMGWAFNPNLAERFPAAFWHTRYTRSPNDVFMAGDSGAGYVNPSLLEEPRPSGLPSGVALWEKHNRAWYKKFGLGITGFVIDGYAPPMPKSVLDAYARFSPRGTVAQKIPELSLHNGMPLLRMTRDLDHDPRTAARQVVEMLTGNGPSFHIFRAVLKSPSWYRDVVKTVQAEHPDAEIVDPYTLMDVARHHLEEEQDTPGRPGSSVPQNQ